MVVTETVPSTFTPYPTETPLPHPTQPTVIPVEGITSAQLNVRVGPSTASTVLGIIPANSKVQIIGKDIGEGWWQVVYESGNEEKGWVTAQYVETASRPDVPVVGSDGTNPQSANMAVVIQQLNIRSGPGTSFNSLGILNVNDVVLLTGKNENGTWLQIDLPPGPNGKGWINSEFVKANDVDSLPVISDSGEVIGTGTPADTPLPPTPTLVPAPMDFDSPDNPIKTVLLGGVGTHTALYNGDVSAPAGDKEDWVQITPFTTHILLEITCRGNEPYINLTQNGQIIGSSGSLHCNTQEIINVTPDTPMTIHVQASAENTQSYSSYIIKVTTIQ